MVINWHIISLIIVSVMCAISLGILIVTIIMCLQKTKALEVVNKHLDELKKDIEEKEKQLESPEYSESILKYIQTYTTQITYLRFREFIDGHKTEKITRETTKRFTEQVAKEVKNSFNENNISFDKSLFTHELYNAYIINTCINVTKQLLTKVIDTYDVEI